MNPALWAQNYDPLHNAFLSTLVAAIPVTLLFYLLAVRKITAWLAAVWELNFITHTEFRLSLQANKILPLALYHLTAFR